MKHKTLRSELRSGEPQYADRIYQMLIADEPENYNYKITMIRRNAFQPYDLIQIEELEWGVDGRRQRIDMLVRNENEEVNIQVYELSDKGESQIPLEFTFGPDRFSVIVIDKGAKTVLFSKGNMLTPLLSHQWIFLHDRVKLRFIVNDAVLSSLERRGLYHRLLARYPKVVGLFIPAHLAEPPDESEGEQPGDRSELRRDSYESWVLRDESLRTQDARLKPETSRSELRREAKVTHLEMKEWFGGGITEEDVRQAIEDVLRTISGSHLFMLRFSSPISGFPAESKLSGYSYKLIRQREEQGKIYFSFEIDRSYDHGKYHKVYAAGTAELTRSELRERRTSDFVLRTSSNEVRSTNDERQRFRESGQRIGSALENSEVLSAMKNVLIPSDINFDGTYGVAVARSLAFDEGTLPVFAALARNGVRIAIIAPTSYEMGLVKDINAQFGLSEDRALIAARDHKEAARLLRQGKSAVQYTVYLTMNEAEGEVFARVFNQISVLSAKAVQGLKMSVAGLMDAFNEQRLVYETITQSA